MNNEKIYSTKLSAGDEVRVIAPSRSLAIISQESRKIAKALDESIENLLKKYGKV